MTDKKRVFITGASAGFGRDATKALAERGHVVHATMRGINGKNASAAKELQAWAKAGGHTVHVIEGDVTDEASIGKAVARAVAKGGIDVVINNAGTGTWGIDEGFTIEQARAIFDVNVLGPIRVNRAAVPHLRAQGKGLILYVSSGLGRIVFPFKAIYGSSKFAVEGYAESTSYELAPLGIETVIVQPGAYGTGFLQNCLQPKGDVRGDYGPTAKIFEAFGGAFEQRAASGGLGDPADVVRALVEEVERPAGARPLRRTIGADVESGVGAINATAAQVQDQLATAFGLK